MITNTGWHLRRRATWRALVGALLILCSITSCNGGMDDEGDPDTNPSSVKVSSVQPPTGPSVGGILVTLKGKNFVAPNTVTIGGKQCTDVVTVNKQTITCMLPAGTPGTSVEVRVKNELGTGKLKNGFLYATITSSDSDLNADGIADLVIGSPSDDSSGDDKGSVFVFFGSENPANLADVSAANADLRLSGASQHDNFGISVGTGDVNGDGSDDLIVGANLVDGIGAADAGATYVFLGPLDAPSPISAGDAEIKLLGETGSAGDRFGSVVQACDVSGDGRLDVVVAATMHEQGAALPPPSVVDTGCVYVFKGGISLHSQDAASATYKFGGAGNNEHLGNSLTSGDLNGDGIRDLVIGAQLADATVPVLQPDAGAVYVIFGTAQLVSQAPVTPDAVFVGEATGDEFGTVTCVADVTGDGTDDLVASAPRNDWFDVNAGRVYVFSGGPNLASTHASMAPIKLSSLPLHNGFGKSMQLGDVDGDGVHDLWIGAPHADWLNDGNGRAYLFLGGAQLASAVVIEADKIVNGEPLTDEAFGSTVALADVDGDEIVDLIGAAPMHQSGHGRVYVFRSGEAIVAQESAASADLKLTGASAGSLFGSSVSNGD